MSTCLASVELYMLRATLADADGSPLVGPDSQYVSDAPIQAQISLEIEAGDKFTQKNGCGSICVTFEDCDRITASSIELQLCQLDAELLSMLTNARLLMRDDVAVGIEVAAPDAACADGVIIELWTKAWDNNTQATDAGNPQYFQFVFPLTTGVLGQHTLQHGILQVPVTLKGKANPNAGDGPNHDWPETLSECYAWFLTDEVPEAACGFQALAS